MVHELFRYFPLLFSIILLVAAIIFADWKNWREYYSTILFAISVDFFIAIITYKHSLWFFHKSLLVPNHTIADFFIAYTNIPLIILTFLSHYPNKTQFVIQFSYIFVWSIVFTVIETIFLLMKLMSYHNGWNFWWSLIVWFFIFIGITIHQKRPLLAWGLCFICTIFLVLYFQIPVLKLK
ncbi:CBO0543 family protein [Bacillus salipaludis]|uniref:CBO0543 family protein n=1 Tax=Bacillus salipaludis TaxID=2547811 RepID=UPI0026CE9321